MPFGIFTLLLQGFYTVDVVTMNLSSSSSGVQESCPRLPAGAAAERRLYGPQGLRRYKRKRGICRRVRQQPQKPYSYMAIRQPSAMPCGKVQQALLVI